MQAKMEKPYVLRGQTIKKSMNLCKSVFKTRTKIEKIKKAQKNMECVCAYNAIEFALSILTGEEPKYKNE